MQISNKNQQIRVLNFRPCHSVSFFPFLFWWRPSFFCGYCTFFLWIFNFRFRDLFFWLAFVRKLNGFQVSIRSRRSWSGLSFRISCLPSNLLSHRLLFFFFTVFFIDSLTWFGFTLSNLWLRNRFRFPRITSFFRWSGFNAVRIFTTFFYLSIWLPVNGSCFDCLLSQILLRRRLRLWFLFRGSNIFFWKLKSWFLF